MAQPGTSTAHQETQTESTELPSLYAPVSYTASGADFSLFLSTHGTKVYLGKVSEFGKHREYGYWFLGWITFIVTYVHLFPVLPSCYNPYIQDLATHFDILLPEACNEDVATGYNFAPTCILSQIAIMGATQYFDIVYDYAMTIINSFSANQLPTEDFLLENYTRMINVFIMLAHSQRSLMLKGLEPDNRTNLKKTLCEYHFVII